ncbi:F0F1 ATP synthase subunit epsilon [Zhengella mangrovi]|uniref:ATP synthase epsilon chain n=1 Tax=Zhengella mangrovi TaxID=1982044 RepID=A0A2G1QSD8_9HYPH|nr:F0F1 ATP synthase subunit epsilon [Zhengella mangrovi]PHP68443.1 F0F1 ATP synthase subunit epsilon [Zhengella mangrovi]
MAQSFKFELVSPERLLISEEVETVVIPGADGEMTVMASHAPLMTSIRPGVMTVNMSGGKAERYVIFGGFADVMPESCTVLAEAAVHVDDIDRGDLEQRIADAREDLADAQEDDHKQRAQEYLDQLTTLHGAILPA